MRRPPGQCYVTTQQVIDTKPELLTRAIKALHASAEEMVDKPLKPLFERASKDYDIPGIKGIDSLVAAEKAVIDQLCFRRGAITSCATYQSSGLVALPLCAQVTLGNPPMPRSCSRTAS